MLPQPKFFEALVVYISGLGPFDVDFRAGLLPRIGSHDFRKICQRF
jgi:hypothetical protein